MRDMVSRCIAWRSATAQPFCLAVQRIDFMSEGPDVGMTRFPFGSCRQ